MLALVPESMWSIRCPMGCPMVMLASETALNFSRTSFMNSSLLLSSKTKGASISAAFTPCACSSNSALPVLREVIEISGTDSRIFSILFPILFDSSSDMPGKLTALIVNVPSLNSGKKLRPKPNMRKIATMNNTMDIPSTGFLIFITFFNAEL